MFDLRYLDFFRQYFGSLEKTNNGHCITVVLYSRVFYQHMQHRNRLFLNSMRRDLCSSDVNAYQHDKNSVVFRDFFHKIHMPKKLLKEQSVDLI